MRLGRISHFLPKIFGETAANLRTILMGESTPPFHLRFPALPSNLCASVKLFSNWSPRTDDTIERHQIIFRQSWVSNTRSEGTNHSLLRQQTRSTGLVYSSTVATIKSASLPHPDETRRTFVRTRPLQYLPNNNIAVILHSFCAQYRFPPK